MSGLNGLTSNDDKANLFFIIKFLLMMTFKTFFSIAIVFYFLLPYTLNAQYRLYWTEEKMQTESAKVVENSDYIFEGIPTDYEYYYGPNKEIIYTSYTVDILHVYRGEGLKKGSIQIIARGGEVGGDTQFRQHGGARVGVNGISKFIFFCKENKYPLPVSTDNDSFTNEKVCEFYKEERYTVLRSNEYTWGKPSWRGLFDIGFLNRVELNAYFSKFENMSLFPIKTETKKLPTSEIKN